MPLALLYAVVARGAEVDGRRDLSSGFSAPLAATLATGIVLRRAQLAWLHSSHHRCTRTHADRHIVALAAQPPHVDLFSHPRDARTMLSGRDISRTAYIFPAHAPGRHIRQTAFNETGPFEQASPEKLRLAG